jgi:hypothetical protein
MIVSYHTVGMEWCPLKTVHKIEPFFFRFYSFSFAWECNGNYTFGCEATAGVDFTRSRSHVRTRHHNTHGHNTHVTRRGVKSSPKAAGHSNTAHSNGRMVGAGMVKEATYERQQYFKTRSDGCTTRRTNERRAHTQQQQGPTHNTNTAASREKIHGNQHTQK